MVDDSSHPCLLHLSYSSCVFLFGNDEYVSIPAKALQGVLWGRAVTAAYCPDWPHVLFKAGSRTAFCLMTAATQRQQQQRSGR
jgi:hypothetical protein